MQSNFGWSICPDLGKIYASLLSIYKFGDLHPLHYGSGEPNELWAFYCGEGGASSARNNSYQNVSLKIQCCNAFAKEKLSTEFCDCFEVRPNDTSRGLYAAYYVFSNKLIPLSNNNNAIVGMKPHVRNM